MLYSLDFHILVRYCCLTPGPVDIQGIAVCSHTRPHGDQNFSVVHSEVCSDSALPRTLVVKSSSPPCARYVFVLPPTNQLWDYSPGRPTSRGSYHYSPSVFYSTRALMQPPSILDQSALLLVGPLRATLTAILPLPGSTSYTTVFGTRAMAS